MKCFWLIKAIFSVVYYYINYICVLPGSDIIGISDVNWHVQAHQLCIICQLACDWFIYCRITLFSLEASKHEPTHQGYIYVMLLYFYMFKINYIMATRKVKCIISLIPCLLPYLKIHLRFTKQFGYLACAKR